MYGFVLEGISHTVSIKYGEEKWDAIRKAASVNHKKFTPTKVYSETLVPRLVKSASEVLGEPAEDILEMCGLTFLPYITTYGYDRILRVMGRHMTNFLNNLDNLHEYLRFTYPKLKPPSFFCEAETRAGLTLHYRSRRKDFVYYVIGQITQVAHMIYDTPIEIEVVSEEESSTLSHVVMKLHFDNTGYVDLEEIEKKDATSDALPIMYDTLVEVFPFHLVFNENMIIKTIGTGLAKMLPRSVGQALDEMFTLLKPMVEFTYENILLYTNNSFELVSMETIHREIDTFGNTITRTRESIATGTGTDEMYSNNRLRLKGQMIWMKDWMAVIFLATPIMDNLERMYDIGIFINDLSIHDSSRDMVLLGTQQQAELKMALAQEKQKSARLEESMASVDKELRRTDALLYQMIPKVVADKIKNGEPAIKTCSTFDSVTILFTDVCGFTSICSKLIPMNVVNMLNEMYTQFDKVCEKHRVYKVETIGDAYMVVSGAPVVTKFHAVYITDMSFDLVEVMSKMQDPSKEKGSNMRIRLGIHTGAVVAGCVGIKMPRYCLIGETVNIANKMESSGQPMKIHISQTTKDALDPYSYVIEDGYKVPVGVGGAEMMTYFVLEKPAESSIKGPMAAMMEVLNVT